MTYKVKLNIFEGPLDLLLFLIRKEKIDIYDIPVSRVTQQYLEYMELMKLLDLEIAGEFLVMAATLMHIKSRMLLPPEESEEAEAAEEDPREELVRRLLEYKKFKDAAGQLKKMREEQADVFFRRGEGEKGKVIADDGTEYFEASLFDLISAFRKALISVPKEVFHEVVKNTFTVGDKIHQIYHALARNSRAQFSSFFGEARDRDEMIVTFLAILELMKMSEIMAVQSSPFGEIELIRSPGFLRKGKGPAGETNTEGQGQVKDGERKEA